MPKFSLLILSSILFSVCACSTSNIATYRSAQALVTSPTNKSLMANITFEEAKEGIKVNGQVSGLATNTVHAIHVHESGVCEGDFSTAGGHFNPQDHSHGGPAALNKHAGDLGNLVSNDKGEARFEVLIMGINVRAFIGKAVIIHAKADDLISQPSGNAGARIACGVVKEITL